MLTTFLTDYIWRRVSPEIRRQVLAVLPRAQVVGRYAGNVHNDLRIRGEHVLADNLLAEIDYLREYKQRWGALPPPCRRSRSH